MNYTEYYKITKAARGWKASEMDTWSDEKKRQILDQYGKEGLTPNTYAYLQKRVTPLSASTSQSESNQPKQNIISKITSIFAPKKMTIDEAKKYDEGWALKNYERMTGNKYEEGTSLKDYTRSAIRKKLLKYGMNSNLSDGKWGKISQSYMDKYNSSQSDPSLQSSNKNTKSTFKVGDFISSAAGTTARTIISNPVREILYHTPLQLKIDNYTKGIKNEKVRDVVQFVTSLPFGKMVGDAVESRVAAALGKHVTEKADIKKGTPTITVDKSKHLLRYYDEDGNLVMSSPVTTGMYDSKKEKTAGDRQTPKGNFKVNMGYVFNNSDNKHPYDSFGDYFYRTNIKNSNGTLTGIGIHGTGTLGHITMGTNGSHGCMRVPKWANEQLHELLGTNVNPNLIISKNGGLLNYLNYFKI